MEELRLKEDVGRWRVIGAAATGWLAMIVVVSGVVIAAALGSLTVLGAALVLHAVIVATQLVRPAYWRKVREAERRRPVPLPLPGEFRHPVLASAMRAMRLARLARERAAEDLPRDLRDTVEPALARGSALEVSALRLMAHAERLTRWLDGVSAVELRAEMARCAELAERAQRASSRQCYLDAHRARVEQLSLYEQIAAERDGCLASLAPILAGLDDLPFRLARLRFVEAELDAARGGAGQDELARLRSDIAQLEGTTDALDEASPSTA